MAHNPTRPQRMAEFGQLAPTPFSFSFGGRSHQQQQQQQKECTDGGIGSFTSPPLDELSSRRLPAFGGERAVCRLDPFNVGRTATLSMFPY